MFFRDILYLGTVPKENDMPLLSVGRHHALRHDAVVATMHQAKQAGFIIGREVMVGNVPGWVAAYNVAGFGEYPADRCPLVVMTPFGETRCSLDEVRLV